MATCPQCGNEFSELQIPEKDLVDKFREKDSSFSVPEQACRSCLNDLRKQAYGVGGVFIAQQKAMEQKKQELWRGRVNFVKSGHNFMNKQLFSDAAVSYEKYIRTLEIVFDCESGQLSPQIFKEQAKTAELTVITGVYWDLVRIYDTSDKYADRQKVAANQLAKFIGYTPIYAELIRKAQNFLKKGARNPEVIKNFLKAAGQKHGRCFIATSAFEIPLAHEILVLKKFRDDKLKSSKMGRKFITIYYKVSPAIACHLDRHKYLKPAVRTVLRAVIKCVS